MGHPFAIRKSSPFTCNLCTTSGNGKAGHGHRLCPHSGVEEFARECFAQLAGEGFRPEIVHLTRVCGKVVGFAVFTIVIHSELVSRGDEGLEMNGGGLVAVLAKDMGHPKGSVP